MSTFTKYIANEEHYSEVISRIAKVRETLWIGTADIKDVYVKQDGDIMPLLGQLATLLKRGVGVRLVHAKEVKATSYFPQERISSLGMS